MNFIQEWLISGTLGSLNSILSIAIIVIPLMLFMEIAKDLKLLDYIGRVLKPVTQFFKADESAGFPLAVGLIFGISYGAGVLIQSNEKGDISPSSMVIVSFFLAACHALFEDTLLFVAIGSVGWIILSIRIIMATVVTFLVSRMIKID